MYFKEGSTPSRERVVYFKDGTGHIPCMPFGTDFVPAPLVSTLVLMAKDLLKDPEDPTEDILELSLDLYLEVF